MRHVRLENASLSMATSTLAMAESGRLATPIAQSSSSSSAAGGCTCSLSPPSLASRRSVRCPPLGAANAPPAAAPLHLSQISSQRMQKAGSMSLTIFSPEGLSLSDRPRSAIGPTLGQAVCNRVAYQGVPGAYSEQAALKACPEWEHIPCDSFELVFQALSQWSADRAVVPIENSLGGSIHDNIDLLMRYRLHIVGETLVDVNHCLMAAPGVAKEEIRRVISHPQALSQVDGYLRRLPHPEGVREAVSDTAGAAQMIADQGWRDVGAIASRRAAELYGLTVLDEGIQDNPDNVTRFLVLAREPLVIVAPRPGTFKTTIVFSLIERSGGLYRALSVFAMRDINLTKIESRPLRSNPLSLPISTDPAGGAMNSAGGRRYNYLFFIDFEGSTAEEPVQNALKNLEEFSTYLRVLGSYPMAA